MPLKRDSQQVREPPQWKLWNRPSKWELLGMTRGHTRQEWTSYMQGRGPIPEGLPQDSHMDPTKGHQLSTCYPDGHEGE